MAYRGEDRRTAARVTRPNPFDPSYRFAAAACVAVAAAGVTVGLLGTGTDERDAVEWLVETAAAAAILTAAGLAALRWRVEGSAPSLWTAVALVLLGAGGVGMGDLLPLVWGDSAIGAAIASAATLGGAAVLIVAARQPEVDVGMSAARVVATVTAATTALGVIVFLLDVERVTPLATASPPYGIATVAGLAWTVAAVACARRARRTGRDWTLAWVGLLAGVVALNQATYVIASLADRRMLGTPRMLLLLGALLAVRGAVKDLQLGFVAQRAELWRSKVSAETATAQATAARVAAEERAHEARNALAAIGGAIGTLERYHDRLPEETRQSLASAVAMEVERLQRLVTTDVAVGRPTPFRVAEAVAPAITGSRALGLSVTVEIPPELTALGRWADTAQVVQNLLENVRRHGGGTAAVSAAVDGDRVVLRVSDQGKGIAAEERDAIFERGVRGLGSDGVEGSGIGLYVSRRLMIDQGGDLRLDGEAVRGAAFVATLPAAAGSESGGEPASRTPLVDARQQII